MQSGMSKLEDDMLSVVREEARCAVLGLTLGQRRCAEWLRGHHQKDPEAVLAAYETAILDGGRCYLCNFTDPLDFCGVFSASLRANRDAWKTTQSLNSLD